MTVQRALLTYFGGKWRIAPWIIQQMPPHEIYVEPFGGAASVLLRKPPAKVEIYNDLYDDLVNLFQVLRSDDAGRLVEQLELTPYAEAEFNAAYEPAECNVERARRLIVRSLMGFGSKGATENPGFRGNAASTVGKNRAEQFAGYVTQLPKAIERLKRVAIMNGSAIKVMQTHDSPQTLHYVDPPYLPETRVGGEYKHEMTREQHVELLDVLMSLQGKVILSGYASDLYDNALKDWRRLERKDISMTSSERTEVLWMNFASDPDLFSVGL